MHSRCQIRELVLQSLEALDLLHLYLVNLAPELRHARVGVRVQGRERVHQHPRRVVSLAEECNLILSRFGESFAFVCHILEFIQLMFDHFDKLFNSNSHDSGALGVLLYLPLVSIAHRSGGLGKSCIILNRDKIWKSWKCCKFSVIRELDTVVVLCK